MAMPYFHYSTMNAGKITVLPQSPNNDRKRGMRPLLLTRQWTTGPATA